MDCAKTNYPSLNKAKLKLRAKTPAMPLYTKTILFPKGHGVLRFLTKPKNAKCEEPLVYW
jgi:hypothetical protein